LIFSMLLILSTRCAFKMLVSIIIIIHCIDSCFITMMTLDLFIAMMMMMMMMRLMLFLFSVVLFFFSKIILN
jgi:hypothetical protein